MWATDITYTFNSASWGASDGTGTANWTSGSAGNWVSAQGVQVTTGNTGANATSPTSLSNISKVVVTYSTNATKGTGSISIQVGSGTAKSQSVTKTGGTTDRTLEYSFSPTETGTVKITVNCTQNSIYIRSVKITYSATPKTTAPTIDGGGASTTFTISKDVAITAGEGATIYYTMGDTPADPTTSSTVYESAIHITGSTTIKAIAKKDGEDASTVVSKTFTKVLADNTINVTSTGGTMPSVDRTGGSAVDDWTPTASATSGGTINYAVKSTTNLTQGTDFTFNTSTGKVSFLTAYKGIIVITASVDADDDYASASQDITLTVNGDRRDPVNAYDGEDTEISSTGSLVIDTDLIETDGAITVESSDTGVATVSEYTISAVADGTTTITINTAEGTYYNAGSATFELTVVTPSACDIALTGAPVSKTFDVYNNATPQVINYTTSSAGAVSIASSPYATFDIDQVNKKITVTPKSKTPSAQTITINQAAAGRYLAGSTTFSLTVNNSATTNTFEKVTNASDVEEGNIVTFVNEDAGVALGEYRSDKHNFGTADVTISDNAFSLAVSQTDVTLLTLEATTATVAEETVNAWYFNTGSGYLYASSSGSNYMDVGTLGTAGNNAKGTLEISSGNAIIKFRGTYTRNWIRKNSQNDIFSCYGSGQDAIQLYKLAKYNNVITVTNGTAQTLELENEQELTLSATSYCGAVSFAYKSATGLTKDKDFTFDPATGELVVDENSTSGTITITASTAESATHKAASTDIVITVVGKPIDPDFSDLADQEVLAGETYTLVNGVDFVTDGDVTLSSSNTSVATVDGLVVTAVAVGEATITVTAATGTIYKSGSDTFTFTVTAPAGKSTVNDVEAFSEDFSSLTASGPGSDFNSRGSELTSFGSWTIGKAYQSGSCVSLGTGSALGEITTPSFTVVSGKTYHLTFKAAPWNTESETSMKVTVTGGKIDSKSSATSSSLATKKWTTIEYDIVASSTSMTLDFQAVTNNRVWLDDVSVTTPSTATVTLNKYGYATYCSVNPMDFSSTTGYTAWRVSDISGETITFSKITEAIKGGQGVLLYNKNADGVNTTNVTVSFANSSKVYDSDENLFVGTTAPLYVEKDEYIGLSGDKFVYVNAAGNVPAGKALLPASAISAGARQFVFLFDEDATGIAEMKTLNIGENENYYNLNGQKVENPTKGLYIVNGRKVVIK